MKRGKKKRRAGALRFVFLALLATSGAILYWQRCDVVAGVRAYLLRADALVVDEERDLPSSRSGCEKPARVAGIPDYRNLVRLPGEAGGTVTCFRVLDFGNRLLVCSPAGLKPPEDIEEIIRKRKFEGALVPLRKSPRQVAIRRGFRRAVGVSLSQDAFLLEEGMPAVPPVERFGILVMLAVLCCFSGYRVIKGFG